MNRWVRLRAVQASTGLVDLHGFGYYLLVTLPGQQTFEPQLHLCVATHNVAMTRVWVVGNVGDQGGDDLRVGLGDLRFHELGIAAATFVVGRFWVESECADFDVAIPNVSGE